MSDIVFNTTKTAKISGTSALDGETLRNFANAIPTRALIEIRESKSYPGERGVGAWSLTASWKEN